MHIDVCLVIENCVLVDLDWVSTYDAIYFQHVICSWIFHAYVLFHSYFWIVIVFCFLLSLSLSLFLSLSRIDCKWHLSTNLLRLRILLVPGLLLLIFPFPLFTFGFVMGRPNRTSLRTFRNMAFIQSALSLRRTFPTLLSLWSFGLGAGNLFVSYP